MSSDDIAIRIGGVSKRYEIYDQPRDRLKQFILPRLRSAAHLAHRDYFHEFWALRDVSFDVRKGETVGIVGRNGSGKSTLLQIVCGTLAPTTGGVTASGRIAALLELGSGFNPEFTGRENVYLNGALLGLSREEIDSRFDDIAAFADIGDFIEQPVKIYSSGMMVRLAFAVAINVDPQILIVDEALSVGDELFQRKCFSRIEWIKNAGATILFVSHSASTVVELCDRTVLLDGGEMLVSGQPKAIVSKYQKLLYAPTDERWVIREEIRRANATAAPIESLGSQEPLSAGATQEIPETFDPHLVPTSTVEFVQQGAQIELPRIETLDGQRVNGLIRGRRYRYCFQAKFARAASFVRFGMVIKTVSGFSIGGALSAPQAETIPFVETGSTISVCFTFTCFLNPGTYFMNAGIFGSSGKEETVLHRLVDVVAFRVIQVERDTATEIVDFGCIAEMKVNA